MKEENVWGRKLEEMIHVHVEVARSTRSAVVDNNSLFV